MAYGRRANSRLDSRTPTAILTAALLAVGLLVAAPSSALADPPQPPRSCDPDCPSDPPDKSDDPPGEPKGGDGLFTGAALFSRNGDVVSAPGGSSGDTIEWRLAQACGLGGRDICHALATCNAGPPGDADDGKLFESYFRRDGGPWVQTNDLCLGRDEPRPVTVEDVGNEIRDRWIAYVPMQDPSMQPPDGKALVNLPAIFDSGQPAEMPETAVPVFNFTVNLRARGEWIWTFAPGVHRSFGIPGSTYPDQRVSYTYGQAGQQTVILNTRWWGSFTVGNQGPWDIQTPATQGPYNLPLTVVQAKPVLTR